jgi:hypothetical protein
MQLSHVTNMLHVTHLSSVPLGPQQALLQRCSDGCCCCLAGGSTHGQAGVCQWGTLQRGSLGTREALHVKRSVLVRATQANMSLPAGHYCCGEA